MVWGRIRWNTITFNGSWDLNFLYPWGNNLLNWQRVVCFCLILVPLKCYLRNCSDLRYRFQNRVPSYNIFFNSSKILDKFLFIWAGPVFFSLLFCFIDELLSSWAAVQAKLHKVHMTREAVSFSLIAVWTQLYFSLPFYSFSYSSNPHFGSSKPSSIQGKEEE